MKTLYAPLMILCLGVGACTTPIPVETGYPLTYQRKMQSAHHWDVMATDVANWLQNVLVGTSSDRNKAQAQAPAPAPDIRPITLNIQQPQYGSEAGNVFRDLLITQLVDRGFIISASPGAGLPVVYDLEVVKSRLRIGENTNDEVVVNVSVMNGDRYLVRFSDVYYIPDHKANLYIAQGPTAPTTRIMEVVGP